MSMSTAAHIGNEYRSGVVYFGWGPFRIGYNSEDIRETIQNKWMHKNTGDPYFQRVDYNSQWFFYFGTGTGNSLW